MWLNKLKAALVLKEFDNISILIDEMPAFKTLAEMEQAAYLLQHIKILLEEEKQQTGQTLQQIQNTLNFLKSTEMDQPATLNLKF